MIKRMADLIGGSLLAVVTAPVVLLAVVASAVSLRAAPLFVQVRVGRAGRPFHLLKVRTLAPETPPTLAKHQLDPYRPGPACRFLRSHHLDELPQFVQVITGRMSLVGPRPEMPGLHAGLPLEFAEQRTSVRPGVTGLWQVSRAVEGLIGEAPEYDRYYVEHQNLRLDLWILWRTVASLLGRPPVSSVQDVPAWTLPRRTPVDRQVPADRIAA